MTDNEIVKALEEHYKQVDKGYSTHLEYGGKGDEHEEKYIYMLRDALDLINRQQAKIETLRNCVEQHHIIRKDGKSPLSLLTEEIKADAIKEFAERLKYKFKGDNVCDFLFVRMAINNLVKEMVGEE
jgi:hypothetical protein